MTVAIVMFCITVLGGTYAWADFKQHKSNELGGSMLKHEARLVEDFDEVKDWTTDMGDVKKEISVVNKGKAEDGFGDVYVRIALKEFMEIGAVSYTETEKRYMIDTDGAFVVFETVAEADAAVAAGGVYAGHVYALLTDAVTKTTGYFIQTQDGDPNGQMGKYVITDIDIGNAEKVINPGPEKATDTNHHLHPSEECNYAIHSWKEGSELQTRPYIEWGLNDAKIITMTEWLDPAGAYKGEPVAMWIIEDRDDSGWVYWGQALAPDSATEKFMETVTLIEQPEGSFYYVIHTELEAVSFDRLGEWGDFGDRMTGGTTSGPGTDPGDGPGTDPGPDPEDYDLPVLDRPGGFDVIKDEDPSLSDGYYALLDYYSPAGNIYHRNGSFHLEDIITDENYVGVTATAVDPKYAAFIYVDDDVLHGKPSIVYSYLPLNSEWRAWLTAHGNDELTIPVQVELTRGAQKATITINLYYGDCVAEIDFS